MTNTHYIHLPVQPSYSAQPETNRDARPPTRPDASPQEGARGPRGSRWRRLCGCWLTDCRVSTPHRLSTGPPLYWLGEVFRGSGSRKPPGERLSHMWCRRRVILRHHMCERASLAALTLPLPYRGAQLVRAAVGHGGALRGAAPPGVAGSAAEPPLIPRERAFANCGTPPDTPRSSIESVNTSRQPSIAPFPVSDVASASCGHQTLKNKRQKHLSDETPRRNDEESPGS